MTTIEWTDAVWNPVTGCTKVSAGCKNCYAEAIADRFFAKQYQPNRDGTPRKFTDVRCHPDRLTQPRRWRKPRRVFVNSMSDLFHEDVPRQFIGLAFAIMRECGRHTFQILTKRPERMLPIVSWIREYERGPISPNIWLGVSVENQKAADERIPLLLKTPAAVRFLSVEPMLEHVDLYRGGFTLLEPVKSPTGEQWPGLDWVIVGGESGPGARPFDLAWAESLLEQCRAAGVPFFFKQAGSVPVMDEARWREQHNPLDDRNGNRERVIKNGMTGESFWLSAKKRHNSPAGTVAIALKDRKGGDPAEWPEHLRVREFPREATP